MRTQSQALEKQFRDRKEHGKYAEVNKNIEEEMALQVFLRGEIAKSGPGSSTCNCIKKVDAPARVMLDTRCRCHGGRVDSAKGIRKCKKTVAINAARHREQKGDCPSVKKKGIAENRTPVARWYRS